MEVGSLFSGIGGLDLGLERAGMEIVWQCEIDPFCQSILRKHWPDVPCYSDIRDINEATPRVDLIAGGFPCQPVSLAGKGKAQADERWLWPEFARVVGLLRPRYVLVENVPGLASRGLGDVVGDLAALGYDAEWDVVSAASVGASHLRERVFVVAYPSGFGRQVESKIDYKRGTLVAHSTGERSSWPVLQWEQEGWRHAANGGWWETEPDVGRVAHGVPNRVDRLRALGNGVVPQVGEFVGRLIMEAEKRMQLTALEEVA